MKRPIWLAFALLACNAIAQHTTPNSWTSLIGSAQGWPQDTQGRAIHAVHMPPTNLAMGNRGTILFWGRSNTSPGPVTPYRWVPPLSWENSNGTFSATTELDYEAFCCGHTLMEDGRVVITGSNFGSEGVPDEPLKRGVPQ
jgi:hypothetical protein